MDELEVIVSELDETGLSPRDAAHRQFEIAYDSIKRFIRELEGREEYRTLLDLERAHSISRTRQNALSFILGMLTRNAVDAIREAQYQRKDYYHIRISISKDETNLYIRFMDNGMPPPSADDICLRLVGRSSGCSPKGSDDTIGYDGGFGLGLFNCGKVARVLGGTIMFGQEGVYKVFNISIPHCNLINNTIRYPSDQSP